MTSDIHKIDLMMSLGPNFRLYEFLKSQHAVRNNITIEPTVRHLQNMISLVTNVLQPIRDRFNKPVMISSGYRPWSDDSQHALGLAADFEILGEHDNKLVANYIYNNIDFDQLILEFYEPDIPHSGWIHVSYAGDDANRRETFRAVHTGEFDTETGEPIVSYEPIDL